MSEVSNITKQTWLNFVNNDKIDENVKSYIADSWKRSKSYGVNAHDSIGHIIDGEEFNKLLNDNKDLLVIGIPILNNIYKLIKNTSTIIYITDKDNNILELVGDENIIQRAADEGRLCKGARWLEEYIGTNALSLCMKLDKPIQTVGFEHYCITHHNATCSAAPIHNDSNKIIGAIVITSEISQYNRHSIGIVTEGANLIESQISLFKMVELMDKALNSMTECIIITDGAYKIKRLSKSAYTRLGAIKYDELIGYDIRDLLNDIKIEDLDSQETDRHIVFKYKSRVINCIGSINEIKFNNNSMGVVLVFKEEKDINKIVNKRVGNVAMYNFNNIVTNNNKMLEVIDYAKKVSNANCSILITGESGTGKELFAQSIHNSSNRSSGPFIAINCAALPRDLVESEIFGYEEGAFTGAKKEGMPGKFELADGGTLFLDEIGELPIEVQSKLLRVLDNKKVTRLGSKFEKSVDVRVISATNRDLNKEIANNNFRLDLFYRINIITLKIPSLNERKEDIEILSYYFIDKLNKENSKSIKTISGAFLESLRKVNFNGNIRQLQNIIYRAYYMCDEEILTSKYLPEYIIIEPGRIEDNIDFKPLDDIEKNMIINEIHKHDGNVTQAARTLKMSKSTMYRKMNKYGIDIKKLPV